ncbi:SIR2 family protein [Lysobacteraceae bacterium NML93-0399]|nr:SIR2 family protein [Xanthomonadaceae bacterium NML93-0399]
MTSAFSSASALNRRLAQVLSIEKMPIGFFLGAGCPVAVQIGAVAGDGVELVKSPLIPAVAGLTKLVMDELRNSSTYGETTALIQAVLDEDEVSDQNIEIILGLVRTLQLAAGKGNARGLTSTQLQTLDEAMCKAIQGHVDKCLPDEVTPYSQLAKFLAPRRGTPVEIFTTNYDLLLEQALEEANVPYFDGFVGSRHPFFDLVAIEQDALPKRWARLWKLHGSINWRQHKVTRRVCRTHDAVAGEDLLIHPSHRKYDDSRRMPYLALIDRLRHFLKNQSKPVALFVHGFSFSDEHLNDVIEEGLKANQQSACFAFQYANLDSYPRAIRMAERCQNFTLMGADGEISRGIRRPWAVLQSSFNSNLDLIFNWNPEEFQQDTSSAPAEFKLGDFAAFGRYLQTFSHEDVEEIEEGK